MKLAAARTVAHWTQKVLALLILTGSHLWLWLLHLPRANSEFRARRFVGLHVSLRSVDDRHLPADDQELSAHRRKLEEPYKIPASYKTPRSLVACSRSQRTGREQRTTIKVERGMGRLICGAVAMLLMPALVSCGGGSGESSTGSPSGLSLSPQSITDSIRTPSVAAKAEQQNPTEIQGLSAGQADSFGGIAALHAQGPDVLSERARTIISYTGLPSLLSPQPGSTADVGEIAEGIYESDIDRRFGTGYTFIGPDGTIALPLGDTDAIFGSVAVTGANWTFSPNTRQAYASGFGPASVKGSGTFSPKLSMQGKWGGATESVEHGPLAYSPANALAVSQSSVAGTWTSNSINYAASITVDRNGAFRGTTDGRYTARCDISGSIEQFQPGTAKNMFKVSLWAPYSPYCILASSYTGLGGIALVADGSYTIRRLRLLVGNGRFWLPLDLKKES